MVTVTNKTATIALSLEAVGDGITSGNWAVAHSVTTKNYAGRGTYNQLKTWRLETDASVQPYGGVGIYTGGGEQLPLKSGKYVSIFISQSVSRPDLSGGDTVNQPVTSRGDFHLYILESAATSDLIKEVLQYVDAHADSKEYYSAVTANAAIAAETAGTSLATFAAAGDDLYS